MYSLLRDEEIDVSMYVEIVRFILICIIYNVLGSVNNSNF